MRVETKEYEVYSFSELSREAKDNVIRWLLDDDIRSTLFTENVTEILDMDFPNSDLDVQYSLGYSQGDGLNIYGDLDLSDALNYVRDSFSEEELSTIKEGLGYVSSISLSQNNRYCYSLKDQEDVEGYIYDLEDEDDVVYTTFKKFIEKVLDYMGDLDSKFAKDGYSYFYEMTDEEAEDTCEANNYEFTEDGEIF